MNSDALEPGQRVILKIKEIYEVIQDGDTGEYLVLFTDKSWKIVPPDFEWTMADGR